MFWQARATMNIELYYNQFIDFYEISKLSVVQNEQTIFLTPGSSKTSWNTKCLNSMVKEERICIIVYFSKPGEKCSKYNLCDPRTVQNSKSVTCFTFMSELFHRANLNFYLTLIHFILIYITCVISSRKNIKMCFN